MTTIATPTNLNQANGSFAENKNEIDKYKVAASYHEIICTEKVCISESEVNSQKLTIK